MLNEETKNRMEQAQKFRNIYLNTYKLPVASDMDKADEIQYATDRQVLNRPIENYFALQPQPETLLDQALDVSKTYYRNMLKPGFGLPQTLSSKQLRPFWRGMGNLAASMTDQTAQGLANAQAVATGYDPRKLRAETGEINQERLTGENFLNALGQYFALAHLSPDEQKTFVAQKKAEYQRAREMAEEFSLKAKTQRELFLKRTGLEQTENDGFLFALGSGAGSVGFAIGAMALFRAPAAVSALFGLAEGEAVYEEALRAGIRGNKALAIGAANGAWIGLTEMFGTKILFNLLNGKGVLSRLAGNVFKRINARSAAYKAASVPIVTTAGGALAEGLQEGMQEAGTGALLNLTGVDNKSAWDIVKESAYAFGVAAFIGGGVGGVGGVANFSRITNNTVSQLQAVGVPEDVALQVAQQTAVEAIGEEFVQSTLELAGREMSSTVAAHDRNPQAFAEAVKQRPATADRQREAFNIGQQVEREALQAGISAEEAAVAGNVQQAMANFVFNYTHLLPSEQARMFKISFDTAANENTDTIYQAAAAMYRNPAESLAQFQHFATQNQGNSSENNKSYYPIINEAGERIDVPFERVLHIRDDHSLTDEQLSAVESNLNSFEYAYQLPGVGEYNGAQIKFKTNSPLGKIGGVLEIVPSGRVFLDTVFFDTDANIDNWAKENLPNAPGKKPVFIGGDINSIAEIKRKIKVDAFNQAAAAMYRNPSENISDFIDFVKNAKDSKKSYFETKTPRGYVFQVPSDTAQRVARKHPEITATDWQTVWNNLEDVLFAPIKQPAARYSGEAYVGKLATGAKNYALVAESVSDGRFLITTFFKGKERAINDWIKQKAANTLKPLEVQTSQLTPPESVAGDFVGRPNNSIPEVKKKIKADTFNQAAAAMYNNPAESISKFRDFVLQNQENPSEQDKSYYRFETTSGVPIDVPFREMLHVQQRHDLSAAQWEAIVNALDQVDHAVYTPHSKGHHDGIPILLKLNTAQGKAGLVLEYVQKRNRADRIFLNTAFIGTDRGIDAWIKKETSGAQGKKSPVITSRSYTSIADILGNIKVDTFNQAAGQAQDAHAALFTPKTEEQAEYSKALRHVLNDEQVSEGTRLELGRLPAVYRYLGIKDATLKTNKIALLKAQGVKGHGNRHNVPYEVIARLPELIADPKAVFKSLSSSQNPAAYVAVLDADVGGKPVLAIISPSKDGKGFSFVPTVYERNNFNSFVRNTAEEGKILYVKEKGSDIWGQVQFLPRHIQNLNNNIAVKEDIVNTYNQPARMPEQDPRAQVTFDEATHTAIIEVFKNGDKSSVIHELAHVYLRQIEDMAPYVEDPAFAQTLVDLQEWLGSPDEEGRFSREQHEEFARNFEAYIARGKAPSGKLQEIFEKFAEWLRDIYSAIQGYLDIKPEVAEFFDNLLSSETVEMTDPSLYKGKTSALLEIAQAAKDGRAVTVGGLGIGEAEALLRQMNARVPSSKNIEARKQYMENMGLIRETFGTIEAAENALRSIYELRNSGYRVVNQSDLEYMSRRINELETADDRKDLNAARRIRSEVIEELNKRELEGKDALINLLEAAETTEEITEAADQALDLLEAAYEQTEAGQAEISKLDVPNTNYDALKVKILSEINKINLDTQKETAWAQEQLRMEGQARRGERTLSEKQREDISAAKKILKESRGNKYRGQVFAVLNAIRHLPAADKGKFIRSITAMWRMPNFIVTEVENILRRAREIEVRNYRKYMDGKIRNLLKETVLEQENKLRRAKLGPQEYNIILDLRRALRLTPEQAQEELFSRIQYFEKQSPSRTDMALNQLLSVKAYGLAQSTPQLLRSLYDNIAEIRRAGLEKKGWEKFFNQVTDELKKKEVLDAVDKNNPAGGFKSIYLQLVANWESLLNLITSKDLMEKYSLLLQESDAQVYNYQQRIDALKKVSDIYGIKNAGQLERKLLSLNNEKYTFINSAHVDKRTDLYSVKRTGRPFRETLSKAELITLYIWSQNPILYDRILNAYGQAQYGQMMDLLTRQDKLVGDALQQTAQEQYSRINEVFVRTRGYDLPRVEYYFPSRAERIESEIDFLASSVEMSKNPSFIKGRVDSSLAQMKPDNPFNILFSHIAKASNYIHLSEKVNEIRRVFRSPVIKQAVKDKFGDEAYSLMLRLLDNSTTGGRSVGRFAGSEVMNWITNNYVKGAIGAKPTIVLKQLISVINYSENMPAGQWACGFIDGLKHPHSTIKYMMDAEPYLRARLESGGQSEALSRAVSDSKNLAKLSKLSTFTDIMTASTRYGDMGAIIFGGYPYVKYLQEQGMSKEEAFKLFRESTLRSQQANVKSSLSQLQQMDMNWLIRALFAFRNTPAQYVRKISDSIVQYERGEIDAGQLGKNIMIYGFLNSWMYSMMTTLGIIKFAFGGDWDDLADELMFSPITQFFAVIPLLDDAINQASQQLMSLARDGKLKKLREPSMPILADVYGALNSVIKEDVSFEDWVNLTVNIGQSALGLPAKYAKGIVTGTTDVFSGNPFRGFLKLMGYTENRAAVVTGTKETKKRKKKKSQARKY